MIDAGLISAFAFIFLMLKLNMRRLLAYDVLLDLIFTALLMVAFAGTYSGMMAALVGGCFLSIFLFVAKRVFGYEKFRWRYWRWEYYPPVWGMDVLTKWI